MRIAAAVPLAGIVVGATAVAGFARASSRR